MPTTLEQPARRKLRSWQRRKSARPGEILQAALVVFSQKGYSATRMEDIAALAGITKGTIYLYFQSKEDIYKLLVRKYFTHALADVIGSDAVAADEGATEPEAIVNSALRNPAARGE
jgi:AcrR family transcriptional regulator